jgi:hypothetical protein
VCPTTSDHSLGLARAQALAHCPAKSPPRRQPEPPRPPPPATTACPRRSRLRSNLGHPCTLGEHVVVPDCLPGRERGRLAGIRPAPPSSHAQRPNCKALLLSRVFTANRGHGCDTLDLCRVLSVKVYLQYYVQIVESCKFPRKLYKIRKIANSILLDS